MNSTNPFDLNEFDTTTAFIDGPSLYWAYKSLGNEAQIDMMKLKGLIDSNSRLQSISYYTVFPPKERRGDEGHTPIRPLADFLGYHGYRVITKDARTYQTDLGMRTKGSITLELALDAMKAGQHGMNHVMLFLSDEDYQPLVASLQEMSCRVTVVSTQKDNIVSSDLVWLADNFIELGDLSEHLARRRER